ncbi:bifunctional folylpolyglutamate synthase/dihydrofolate synthase [Dysgonomonas sp. HGC4]|uniref:bifunctional folylpolyglutamate synthase/dihydrofolate synthase n=1 Tax=Dysgonomonas sp. HGC4 TaxID=1658009 RepID=UPI00067FA1FF|nr:folylpolyglutamate synthase/dihydrofolate synthase family protein [Dysgonomonas sp. HGC4]MBD8349623.1 bifunctional folylpolyglutamate synthase/dihydrofolate synthase [Dysgonomonas sp. HGC4]
MNYQETLEYLYSQLPVYQHVGGSAYKEGLDNSLSLDKYFNHPHKKYKTIHVGGTNGKGSTSHLLASILQQAGHKVGLYTSPHLVDFRERIRVNGKKISEQYVVDFVANHKKHFEPIHPSFFELTMMMSFCYFAEQEVDIAIIEVGLGGRLDSTNIITPELSVITNISLDHTQFLGDTLEKIAYEKAGIIKPHIPVVIGEAEGEVRKIFESKAQSVDAPIIFAEDENLIYAADKLDNGSWLFQTNAYPNLKGELGGLPQIKNAATVLCAVDALRKRGIHTTMQSVYTGFSLVTEITGLMGRWQIIQQANPKIICDTGHNVGGIKYVSEQLLSEKYDRLHIVIGMVNDKDISHVLALLPKEAIYYFTRATISRALDEKELADKGSAFDLKGNTFHTVKEAVEAALTNANPDDLIFIGGSNFVVAEAFECF